MTVIRCTQTASRKPQPVLSAQQPTVPTRPLSHGGLSFSLSSCNGVFPGAQRGEAQVTTHHRPEQLGL